ncbi:MAG: endonuclease/exonuclease/phosphatase family protein [Planctomycetota bacterium]|jgi:endonuclease/exonuclease/phosphatase family metal-dependent hydrolase
MRCPLATSLAILLLTLTPPPARSAEGTYLTVATYNINWGNPNLSATLKTIRSLKADLLALQETNRESERVVTRALRKTYPHRRFTKGRSHGADGFSFLSKHPIRRFKHHPPKHGLFGHTTCEIRFQKRWIRVINIHLQPILPKGKASTWELAKLFLETEQIRRKEIDAILKGEDCAEPTLVLGDLNSIVGQSAPTLLKARGLIDSYAAVTPQAHLHTTWHWTYEGREYRYRIDYIFHSPHLKTVKSRIIPCKAGDHYPVVSKLSLTETTRSSQ